MSRRKYNLEIVKQLLDNQNPFFQSGYTKPIKDRAIGEEWVDNKGKMWRKIENGKVSVNKQMDSIRHMLKRICSVCGQNIDFSCDKLDEKLFSKTGKCYTCIELEELALRLNGGWDDYEKLKLLENKLSLLKDFKEKVVESIDYLSNDSGKMGLVMANGDINTWDGKSNPLWLEDAKKDLNKVIEEIIKVEKEIETFKSNK